jgi:hypothetical protein
LNAQWSCASTSHTTQKPLPQQPVRVPSAAASARAIEATPQRTCAEERRVSVSYAAIRRAHTAIRRAHNLLSPQPVPCDLQLCCTSHGPFWDEMQRMGRGLSPTDTRRRPAMGSLTQDVQVRRHVTPTSTRSRGLGRRIHGSVEDTKLSTNKQHTLLFSFFELLEKSSAPVPMTVVTGIGTGLVPSV